MWLESQRNQTQEWNWGTLDRGKINAHFLRRKGGEKQEWHKGINESYHWVKRK